MGVVVERSMVGVGVESCEGVEECGTGVEVGEGWLDGEQAVMNASSARSIAIHFVA